MANDDHTQSSTSCTAPPPAPHPSSGPSSSRLDSSPHLASPSPWPSRVAESIIRWKADETEMIDRMPKEGLSGFDCTEQNVDCFLPLQNCTSTATDAAVDAPYVLLCVLCVGCGGLGLDWERARCEVGAVDGDADGDGNGMVKVAGVVVKTTMDVCVRFGCGDGDGGRANISSHITISLLVYHPFITLASLSYPFRIALLSPSRHPSLLSPPLPSLTSPH